MTRKVWLIIGLVVAITVSGWAFLRGGAAINPDDVGQVALGRTIYAAHCAQCHGANLQGEADWQIRKPNGELPAPPHDAGGHTWHHSDEYLFGVTKHGMARFAPPDYKTAMPAFVGKISDAEIRAVLAYIKSSWPESVRKRQEQANRRPW